MSSHKGPPDKPIEPVDMDIQKKLDIDAQMKKSILLSNPEAIEPQYLLKTEDQAKPKADSTENSLLKSKNKKNEEKFYYDEIKIDNTEENKFKVDSSKQCFAFPANKVENATTNEICKNKAIKKKEPKNYKYEKFNNWKEKKRAAKKFEEIIKRRKPLERFISLQIATDISTGISRSMRKLMPIDDNIIPQEVQKPSEIYSLNSIREDKVRTIKNMIANERQKLQQKKTLRYQLLNTWRGSGIEFSGKSWTTTNERLLTVQPSEEEFEQLVANASYKDTDYKNFTSNKKELKFMNEARIVFKRVAVKFWRRVVENQ
jgi:hypothetical protein